MASSDANSDGEGVIKLSYFGIRKRSDEMGQPRFMQARQVIAQNPTGMLEAFLDTYGDLSGETFCPGVHPSAHEGRKSRVNQSLTANDREDSKILSIARGLEDTIQIPALHSISGRHGSA
jgi:hypothetical protein